jgi:hypothetical protein
LSNPGSPDANATTTDPHATTPTAGRATEADPLERALLLAAEAGRFDVVAQLADELHARRVAAAGNVVSLPRGARVLR